MAFGPHFTAQKFQSVLKTALGKGTDGVAKAMLHIGAQKMLKGNVSTKDAKAVLQKLQRTGAIADKGLANREFGRQERVANQVSNAHNEDIKKMRLDELRNVQAATNGVVRQQAHSVTAIGNQHAVTAGGASSRAVGINSIGATAVRNSLAMSSPVTTGHNFGNSAPVQLMQTPGTQKKPIASTAKPLIDIDIG